MVYTFIIAHMLENVNSANVRLTKNQSMLVWRSEVEGNSRQIEIKLDTPNHTTEKEEVYGSKIID